ncbi:MAG: hypothetical protein QM765_01530 [Myxococcales bacterium]
MICSSCNKKVKDGTSICPHCDAVLDESILGAMPPEGDDDGAEDTPPPKPAPRPASGKRPAAPAAKTPTGKRPAAARRPAPVKAEEEPPESDEEPKPKPPLVQNDGKFVSKYQQYWTDDDPPPKPAAPKGPQSGEGVIAELGPVRGGHDPELVDPMVTLKNLWKGFAESHFEDKMTIASAAMLIICNFMPWRSTPDGDDMGLMTHGIFTFLLACLSIATIWARKSDVLPAVPRNKFPFGAIGAGGLSALIALIFVATSFEKGVKAGRTVTLSEPSFGVFLAIISAAGIVVGGLLTHKREK